MMKAGRLVAVVALLLGCGASEHPAPIPVGDACELAQTTLDGLGCSWRVNSAGETWAGSCHYLADHGYPRILDAAKCVHSATSCAGAKSCR